jgi:hypothetical protein
LAIFTIDRYVPLMAIAAPDITDFPRGTVRCRFSITSWLLLILEKILRARPSPLGEDTGHDFGICVREFSVGVFDRLSLSRPHFSLARQPLSRAKKAQSFRRGSRRLDTASGLVSFGRRLAIGRAAAMWRLKVKAMAPRFPKLILSVS